MHPIFNNGLTSLVNLGKTFSNVKISFAQCISAIRNIREVSSKSRNTREVSSKSSTKLKFSFYGVFFEFGNALSTP
ncbi:hypothetical protein AA909_12895 [Vibrio anguillarum]|nr:hypothetical protein AA909_12895 [Vibrio anguillarum]